MIDHSGTWLPSVYVGLPVLVLSSALLVLVSAWLWRKAEDVTERFLFLMMPVGGVIAIVVCSAFFYYPYAADYHKLQPTAGVVEKVETRAFDTYYVVTFREGAVVRCDDSRCANIKAGDNLRLLCTKEHQFGSPRAADGWGCRWGQF